MGTILSNSCVAFAGGHRLRRTTVPTNPYTLDHRIHINTTKADVRPPTPCLGGPILTPLANKAQRTGVSRFDVERLATPEYHGRMNGVAILDAAYFERCGFNMISTDNVVMCYNNIISAHRCIQDCWINPHTNTYGPQVDRILMKSFELFPKLESTDTVDVVDFYDRFQELSASHLLAVMLYDGVVLRNRFEGLCLPGLGTLRYAECSRALMDLLPWLLPGTLSLRINATLAAIRNESNNG